MIRIPRFDLPELVEKVSALVSKKGEKPADEAPKAE